MLCSVQLSHQGISSAYYTIVFRVSGKTGRLNLNPMERQRDFRDKMRLCIHILEREPEKSDINQVSGVRYRVSGAGDQISAEQESVRNGGMIGGYE